MAAQALPCPTRLRLFLNYDPETGRLTWKRRARRWFKSDADCKRWNTRFADAAALNSLDGPRYLTGTFFGQKVATHRVAWAMFYGEWPEIVDHIDGDPKNNRIENLRSVSHTENNRNQRRSQIGKSGRAGVRFCKHIGRWSMQIRCDNRGRISQSFKTMQEAIAAHDKWKKRLGYHEDHGTLREDRGAN